MTQACRPSDLALALRAERLARGWTFPMAAHYTGLSEAQLKNFERSRFDGCNPTLKTILAISIAYRLKPDFWFKHCRLRRRPLVTLRRVA